MRVILSPVKNAVIAQKAVSVGQAWFGDRQAYLQILYHVTLSCSFSILERILVGGFCNLCKIVRWFASTKSGEV